MQAPPSDLFRWQCVGFVETPPAPEAGAVVVPYICDTVYCDFSDALRAIRAGAAATPSSSPAAAAISTRVCEHILKEIQQNPHNYRPELLDGVIIRRMGRDWIYLQQQPRLRQTNSGGMTCIVDYNAARKMLLLEN